MAPTHPECNKQGARAKHTDLSGSVVWAAGRATMATAVVETREAPIGVVAGGVLLLVYLDGMLHTAK